MHVGDVLGVLLGLLERLVDALLAGHGGRHLLAHAGAEILELRDRHELQALVRDGVRHGGLLGGTGHGVEGGLGVGLGDLGVALELVGRVAAPRGNALPADLLADQLHVVLAGHPGDEVPGLLLALRGRGDGQRPRVEPARGIGLHDRGGGVPAAPGDRGGGRVLDRGDHGRGVVPHGRLALAVAGDAVAVAGGGRAGLPVLADQVHVELGGLPGGVRSQRGVPVHVEPAAAERVVHGGQRGHDLAPAGQAAQADPGDVLVGIGQLGGELADLLPGGLLRHLQALGLEEVLVPDQERRLPVEGHGVEAVLVAQGGAHRVDEVLGVVALGRLRVRLQVLDPAVGRPDGGLVVGDHDDVELAAAGGHGGRDLGTGLVLREGDESDIDVRVLPLELGLQGDRVLHLRVGHDSDDDLVAMGRAAAGQGQCGETEGPAEQLAPAHRPRRAVRRGETRAHGYLCGFVRARTATSGPRGRRPGPGGQSPRSSASHVSALSRSGECDANHIDSPEQHPTSQMWPP